MQAPDRDRRRIDRETIAAHAAFGGWTILALNVRTSHVHVVVKRPGVVPERVTEHGSTRWIFDPNDVTDAVRHVLDEQGADLD